MILYKTNQETDSTCSEASPFSVVKTLQIYASRKVFSLVCLTTSGVIGFHIMSIYFFFLATFLVMNCSSLPDKHMSEMKGKKKFVGQVTSRY